MMPKKRARDIAGGFDHNMGVSKSLGELLTSFPSRSSKKRRRTTTITTTSTDSSLNVFLPRNVPHLHTGERIRIAKHHLHTPSSRSIGRLKGWCSEKWKVIKGPSPVERTPIPEAKPKLEQPEEPVFDDVVVISGRRSSSRKRKQNTRHQEETAEYEEALVMSGKRSSFKHFAPNRLVGFMYRKMFEVDFTILSDGEGYDLLRRMGLGDFLNVPVPRFDKKLCDEFLETFDDKTNSGKVRGRVIALEPHSVALASRLPLGNGTKRAEISCAQTAEQKDALCRMLSDEKKCRGYNIAEVAYGRRTEIFQKLACMLSIKLQCRKECFHFAAEEVLLALDRSIRDGIQMNWADYLCTIIIRACKSKPMNNSVIFQFGEWLSKIIRNKLEEPDEADDGMVVVPVTLDNRGAEMNLVRLPINVVEEKPDTKGRARTDANPESSAELKEIDTMVSVKHDSNDTSGSTQIKKEQVEPPRERTSNGNGRLVVFHAGEDNNSKLREQLRRERERVRELEERVRQLRCTMSEGHDLIQRLLERVK